MSNNLSIPGPSEEFPRLLKPPIVEAAIHWQAKAQKRLEPEALKEALSSEFRGYTSRTSIHLFGMMAGVSKAFDTTVVKKVDDWDGIRLKSDDEKHVIQFKRDGLVFSRTNGYEHWEPFVEAAKEAWHTYLKIAQPVEIDRLGVRFINQIAVATPENLGVYLREPPICPQALQLKDFVYQSTFAVPDQPYSIRVIKVMQPSMPEPLQKSSGLFLDIDVFTNSAISTDDRELDNVLRQIRLLKNKVFFTLVTDRSVELFGGTT